MTTVRPTKDVEWLWELANRPSIWKASGGSQSVRKDQFASSVAMPGTMFLEPLCDGKSIGVVPFYPVDENTYEMHLALTEHGLRAIEGCREAVKWVFANTDCKVVQANFDRKRRDVRLFCGWVGFKVESRDLQQTRMILRKV